VTLLICSRIVYFATAFLHKKNTREYICELEMLQNLPIFLMYFCFLVVHRVILNAHVVMMNQEVAKRKRRVSIYFWVMFSLYLVS